MPNLDLVMTGDCISAVTALGNTERAVRSLQSKAGNGVGVAVSVGGARAAQRDLAGVATAMNATTAAAAGLRSGGAVAGGLGAGAVAARGLTSSLGGTNRALGATQAGVGVLAGRIGDLGRVAGRVPTVMPLPGGGVASIAGATRAVNAHRTALAAQQLQAARGMPVLAAMNSGTAALAGNSAAAAAGMSRMAGASGGAMGAIRGAVADFRGNVAAGMREEMDRAGIGGRYPGTGGPPPVIPPRGGGGGRGGGGNEEERAAAAAGKAGGEIGKGIGTMLMAGMAVGIAANSAYAKHGLDAVNAAISETPGLASKAKDAADELGSGIRDITEGADLDKFNDQFDRLTTANRALGQVQGQIGMQTLATKLDTEAEAADTQTRALARMAPAFDAAIRGSSNLENAVLDGISNPQVVNGVRSLGDSLAQPAIRKGLADITTGATGAALVWGKVATEISGAASKVADTLFGGQNVTDMSSALFGGAAVAALSKGGIATRLGYGALGASTILGSQSLMAQGKDDQVMPMVTNQVLGALLGGLLTKGSMLGVVGGGLLGQGATLAAPNMSRAITGALAGGSIGFAMGGPVGAGIGALGGGAAGAALDEVAPGGWLAPSKENAPGVAGWLRDFGTTSRENTPGIGHVVGLASDYVANTISPDTAPKAPGKEPVTPGQKHPDGPVNTLQKFLADQQKRAGATASRAQQQLRQNRQQRYEQEARAGTGYPAGTPLPQSTTAARDAAADAEAAKGASAAPAAATQQLDQSAQRATQSVQGLGAAMPQVAQHAAALPASVQVPNKVAQSVLAAHERNMNQSASSISNSAQQVGESIPPAVSTGIVKQTPKVCDAAADMGNNMVNCTNRALQSASPSKKFIAAGESAGDGAAIGVNNSAGGAVDAVGSMAGGMLAAVGALGSGVEAASEGAVPIAESGGLMVGYVWARSVATGVDSVLKSADFAQASMPAINSALAKTTLGKLGLLGVAGSGASLSKSANGGMISMPAPVINASFQVIVDGAGPMRVISQQVMDAGFGELADSFGRQRG